MKVMSDKRAAESGGRGSLKPLPAPPHVACVQVYTELLMGSKFRAQGLAQAIACSAPCGLRVSAQ